MARKETVSNDRKQCLKCGKEKPIKRDFYLSNSSNHSDSRYPICKVCIRENLKTLEEDPMSQDSIEAIQNVLLDMNRPFIYTLYEISVEESSKTNKELFGMYLKNVNMPQYRDYTWKESEFQSVKKELTEVVEKESENELDAEIELDNQNRDDVLRMLNYDPFEGESKEDKRHLYNKLVDFLDESTLEDSFKLPAVIEIVKSFNQIDKINLALAQITSDIKNLAQNTGGVKSLIDSKEKMLKSVLALAKDNGISVNHNNNKSKGAGTLSGIIKTLQEKGFEEGEVNIFDVETAQGIKQVADLSNQSIAAQLQFDENDYTGMILEQREMIQELDSKVIKLEEENRLLKKELLKMKKQGGDMNEQ